MDYQEILDNAQSIQEIYRLVKKIAKEYFGYLQAGLLVGLSDLGLYNKGFLGAYYSLNANTIVLNRKALVKVEHSNPELYLPFLFHLMLHEYIHSLGYMDESEVRALAYDISEKYFGEDHLTTRLAKDLNSFLPYLTLEKGDSMPEDIDVEYISGIDIDETRYIM
ncbi:MAG: hypothetical protein KKF44_00355 [Nanoarchaeota archaeon]|nr:hypothetical protein [Nanoarchaeota archaeon]